MKTKELDKINNSGTKFYMKNATISVMYREKREGCASGWK